MCKYYLGEIRASEGYVFVVVHVNLVRVRV
jgi:hypothetical protein